VAGRSSGQHSGCSLMVQRRKGIDGEGAFSFTELTLPAGLVLEIRRSAGGFGSVSE